ncbi:MAG: cobyric acid synthase, partial [Rikenellaceae bacterium]|nr:cobyric acid synthase [Rikenellaceae bacterium]
REVDLVNMPMARHAGAKVILVADIDRGGVFASVYGTIRLLTEPERKLIAGIIINKFRGDIRLFESGKKMLEELCGVPVLGIIPYYTDIHIEEEDSVALSAKNIRSRFGQVNVAVVLLRHMSNFTDFNRLERDPRVHLYYTNNTEEIAKADIVLIPGSKSTIGDLIELRRNGVAQSIIKACKRGATVVGICGGYQMMGRDIEDPDNREGEVTRLPGLGILPVTTRIEAEKQTRQVGFRFLDKKQECSGYEIHMGATVPTDDTPESPVNVFTDGTTDGYFLNGKCFGTYIHGILDNQAVIDYLLAPYREKLTEKSFDYDAFKEEQYDKLADHVRACVDMEKLYEILSQTDELC